jgi:hypothetical protein
MKLFISNRDRFNSENPAEGSNIHKAAFSILSIEITKNNIPITLMTRDVVFEFQKRIDDVYFYEYLGTIQ